jgi:hypothetical protein
LGDGLNWVASQASLTLVIANKYQGKLISHRLTKLASYTHNYPNHCQRTIKSKKEKKRSLDLDLPPAKPKEGNIPVAKKKVRRKHKCLLCFFLNIVSTGTEIFMALKA